MDNRKSKLLLSMRFRASKATTSASISWLCLRGPIRWFQSSTLLPSEGIRTAGAPSLSSATSRVASRFPSLPSTNNYFCNFDFRSTARRMSSAAGGAVITVIDGNNDDDDELLCQQKQAVRKEIRSRLRTLSMDEIAMQSQRVWDRLFALPEYQQAKSIGVFLSMPRGEIKTDPVIQSAVENGKRIYVPQVGKNFEHADMELLQVVYPESQTETAALFHHSWPRNKWDIPEPPADELLQMKAAEPGDIDVLVVPGLAFDTNCNRLGQGKGYYDRFIERMMTSSSSSPSKPMLLVAVGLDCQLVEEAIPTGIHDYPMDMILLPSHAI